MTEMQSRRLRRTSGVFEALYPPFWIVSDTHWGHKNIAGYVGRPEDHEELMIRNWNRLVKPDDTILHLGDVFYGQGSFPEFRDNIAPRLNGRKYLILGNHDKNKVDWKSLGFKVIDPFSIPYNGWEIEFDHYPTEKVDKIVPGQNRIRVHGHIHNNGYGTQRKEAKKGRGKGRKRHDKDHKPYHVNLSVEVTNYAPVRAEDVLDQAIKSNKQRQHYRNIGVKRSVSRV